MTKLQDEINAMTSTAQLVGFYNQVANENDKPQIKRFKTIEEGRDKTYHLAYSLGLDEEAPKPSADPVKPNGSDKPVKGKAAKPAKEKATKEEKPAKEAKPAKEKPAPKEKAPVKGVVEKGELDTRPGTNKHAVVELLLATNGKGVPLKTLAKKVYGDEEQVGNLKMVLKGVQKACDENPRYHLVLDKESATLTRVTR